MKTMKINTLSINIVYSSKSVCLFGPNLKKEESHESCFQVVQSDLLCIIVKKREVLWIPGYCLGSNPSLGI